MGGVPARLTGAAGRGLPVQSGPMMVTDLNHVLGMGDDAPRPARRLTEHLTTIVRAATAAERAGEWWTSAIPCRRRPGRRACLGRIAILRDQPPVPIHWRCSNCTDEGTISNWEGSPYDLRRRGLSAVDEIHEVVVGDEIAASLRGLVLLDPDCERLVFAMHAHPRGAALHAGADDLEALLDSVAAESNHESDPRRRRLDAAFDTLQEAVRATGAQGDRVTAVPLRPERPDLRLPRRRDVAIFRVRVDLDRANPPIWRRIDLRSDLPLDIVHQVLQAAFSWDDRHLYRFALGGRAFDRGSQNFLCCQDVDDNAWGEPDDGLPAADVRLDETLAEPGDTLHYIYDYGDNWELTLRLDEVATALDDVPTATVIDGGRAAPPEDCGGLTDAAELAEVLDEPARFEPAALNSALRRPFFTLYEAGFDRRLLDIVLHLEHTRFGADLEQRMQQLVAGETSHEIDRSRYLGAHQWFLDRAFDGGIPLTAAGYLKPADVEAAANVVPTMGDWIGVHNREVHCAPLLDFRERLQRIGLLRKRKGVLVLTRAGAAAQRDPRALWDHLSARLVPATTGGFDAPASVLLLAYAATSPDSDLPYDQVAAALSELGWRHPSGRPLAAVSLYHLPVRYDLANVSDRPLSRSTRHHISAGAAALARAALRRGVPGSRGLEG